MKLFNYQKRDVKMILKEPTKAALVGSVTGAGKTLVGVEVMHRSGAKVVLIVAPLNTLDSWSRTVASQTGNRLRRVGGVSADNAAYNATRDFMAGVEGWYFVGWEFAIRMDYRQFRMTGVVFDEVHRGSNRKAKTSEMAYWVGKLVAERGGYRVGMSATPFGNKLEGAFAVLRALWPEEKDAYGSFDRWSRRHLQVTGLEVYNARKGEVETIAQYGDELNPGSIIAGALCYIRHEGSTKCCKFHPKGVQAHLKRGVPHRVGVDLTATQMKIYKQMEDDMFAWIEANDYPIDTEGFPMVQMVRLHQICLAVPSTELAHRLKYDVELDESVIEEYVKVSYALDAKSSKIDALVDILLDIPVGEQVLVFTHSRGIIDAAVDRIRKSRGDETRTQAWHGGVKGSEREVLKRKFIAGELDVLVCQIASIAEGVDGLQENCFNEIWLSMSEDMVKNIQAIGRLFRQGQRHTVNVWEIFARGTVEEDQYNRLGVGNKRMRKALTKKN